MNLSNTKKHYRQQQPSSPATILMANDQITFRLAPGEAWNQAAVGLAMLVTSEDYQQTRNGQGGAMGEDGNRPAERPSKIIRRNNFQAEYEPSRHEMRIFDDLDGIVTEM